MRRRRVFRFLPVGVFLTGLFVAGCGEEDTAPQFNYQAQVAAMEELSQQLRREQTQNAELNRAIQSEQTHVRSQNSVVIMLGCGMATVIGIALFRRPGAPG